LFWEPSEPARTWVHGADKDTFSGKGHGILHSCDGYDSILQRLAKRFEYCSIELWHFIHKKATEMRHRNFAWLGVLASANNRGV
jgi:hypothetical protein